MKITATAKNVRVSPRKIRLVADAMRSMRVDQALASLGILQKRAALPLAKTLSSAVANAMHNAKVSKDDLVIQSVEVSQGQALKRFRPSTRGRVHPYKKRASHITVVLETKEDKK